MIWCVLGFVVVMLLITRVLYQRIVDDLTDAYMHGINNKESE